MAKKGSRIVPVMYLAALFARGHNAAATLTVECLPVSGAQVTGGDVVEVECFVTSDEDELFVGVGLD
jgi:hypothetical protein